MTSRHLGAVRKLFATDLSLFRDHLMRLDAETRRNRFIGPVNDAFLAGYAARCFAIDAIVFAYVEDGAIRGAAELHPVDGADPHTAEAAFSVEPALRRRGIGAALFERLIMSARNRGVSSLRMNCLADNEAMQALARRFDVRLAFDRWQIVGNLDPKGPTAFTIYAECADDARGFMTAAVSLVRRTWTREPKPVSSNGT